MDVRCSQICEFAKSNFFSLFCFDGVKPLLIESLPENTLPERGFPALEGRALEYDGMRIARLPYRPQESEGVAEPLAALELDGGWIADDKMQSTNGGGTKDRQFDIPAGFLGLLIEPAGYESVSFGLFIGGQRNI
jgi:hypothetical protein